MINSWVPKGFTDPRSRAGRVPGTVLNISLIFLMVAWSLSLLQSVTVSSLVLGLGIIGIWRHGWGILNFLRALRFRKKSELSSSDDMPDPTSVLLTIGHLDF